MEFKKKWIKAVCVQTKENYEIRYYNEAFFSYW